MLPRFSLIGSYPLVYLTARDQVRCAEHASPDDRVEVHIEGPPLECEEDGCEAEIESAYGDPYAEESE